MPAIRIRTLALVTSVIAIAATQSAAQAKSQASPQLIAQVDSVMNALMALDVSPGAGIVVVRDTQIVYMKGFGYADVAAKRPFGPETEFYIASTTKSFTGLAAALLDRKGAFKLDAPLSKYLPSLKLKSPMTADSITIRSLLTHTHGIGNAGPLTVRLAYSGEYKDNAELMHFLEQHDAARTGRAYNYGNIGYNVAALAMDAATKQSWKDVLQTTLFIPLGMKHTSAYVSKFTRDDLATPYMLTLAGWNARPYGKADANMQSAGGLITTLRDMGIWLEANINDGRVDGKQVLPASAFAEAHSILAPIKIESRGGTQVGYGFGWNITVSGSDTVLVHGGGFPGFSTHMSFVPGRRIGVAVFANNGELGSGLVDIAAAMVYQTMTGGAMNAPSMEQVTSMVGQMRERMGADMKRRAARSQDLPFPLDAYTGTFENPMMGHMRIDAVNGKLEAHLGPAWSAVEVFDNTKNLLRIDFFGGGEVVSVEMKDGKAVGLSFSGNEFKRVN